MFRTAWAPPQFLDGSILFTPLPSFLHFLFGRGLHRSLFLSGARGAITNPVGPADQNEKLDSDSLPRARLVFVSS